jgi:RNA polymerase sigma factor (sigma-70 family)
MLSTPTDFSCEYRLIKELQAGNTAAYTFLYKNYYPSIAHFITQNKGNKGDAEDIFQEAVICLHQKLLNPEFHVNASLKTYLFGIAKNCWLKKLRDTKVITVKDEDLLLLQAQTEDSPDEQSLENQHGKQVHEWLDRITTHCQQVLKSIYFEAEPMNNLMDTMGWKNKHTASNQKYKCIQQIKKVSTKGKGAK